MTTWAEFKTMARRSVLGDVDSGDPEAALRWTDENLYDYFQFALTAFASHTALPAVHTVVNLTTKSTALPAGVYEELDLSGVVYFDDGSTRTYLRPVRTTPGLDVTTENGFWTWNDTLYLTSNPLAGTLYVQYFTNYTPPAAADDDTYVLPTPEWAIPALSYLVGAHALAFFAMRSANVRQWGQKPDTGNPEDNSLRVQQEWMLKMYEYELSRHAKQHRSNQLWNS